MKRIIVLLTMTFAIAIVHAQGISFVKFKNWDEVKKTAKKTNKYVFVDAYATWCVPCKMMEQDVFPSPLLKPLFDEKYLSIKVQLDKTNKDDKQLQDWYADADMLKKLCGITSIPSYLVFSPNGEFIAKKVGAITISQLIEFGADSADPTRGYEALLQKYNSGNISHEELRSLAMVSKRLGKTKQAVEIAERYKSVFLDKLNSSEAFSEPYMSFMIEFPELLNTKEKWFRFFDNKSDLVDDMLSKNKGYSKNVADWTIKKDYIIPYLYHEKDINRPKQVDDNVWKMIMQNVALKYGKERSERLLTAMKIGYYSKTKDWNKVIKLEISRIEKNGLDTVGLSKVSLNSLAYGIIFKYGNELQDLNKAISWMKIIVDSNPDHVPWRDTYANLLYKVGRKEEAIAQQTKVISIADKKNISPSRIEGFKQTLEKMKRGEPTWPADSLIMKHTLK